MLKDNKAKVKLHDLFFTPILTKKFKLNYIWIPGYGNAEVHLFNILIHIQLPNPSNLLLL